MGEFTLLSKSVNLVIYLRPDKLKLNHSLRDNERSKIADLIKGRNMLCIGSCTTGSDNPPECSSEAKERLGAEIYFCGPGAPQQIGAIENS